MAFAIWLSSTELKHTHPPPPFPNYDLQVVYLSGQHVDGHDEHTWPSTPGSMNLYGPQNKRSHSFLLLQMTGPSKQGRHS
jgi:hypothetical protein